MLLDLLEKIKNLPATIMKGTRWTLSWLPLLQCLTVFSSEDHKRAAKKFAWLVAMSSSPVLLSILMTRSANGLSNIINDFPELWRQSISVSEQFLYVATFLSPTLYFILERSRGDTGSPLISKQSWNNSGLYKGYGVVLVVSVILLFVTALAFSAKKGEWIDFKDTYLHQILSTSALYIYFFSLYVFYLSILQENVPSKSYVDQTRHAENEFNAGLSNRIKSRGDQ